MKVKTFFKTNKEFLTNVVISTIIGIGASFLNYYFSILLARNLPDTEFGIYSSALGIISLVQIPSLAISSAVTKLVARNRGKSLREFKKHLFKQFFIIALVFSLIFYICSPVVSDISNIPMQYMLPLTAVLFLSFFSPLPKGILYGLEQPNKGNFLSFVESILKILVGFIAVNLYKDSATLPILACGLPLLVTGVLLYPFIGNIKQEEEVREKIDLKEVFTYFLLFFLLSTPFTLDLSLVNPDFRAEYSALSLLGKIVYFASVMISSVMFSKISNLKKRDEKKSIFKVSLFITLLIGGCLSVIYLLVPDVINSFIYGNRYPEIAEYLGVYGVGMTLYAGTYLIYNYFIAEGYTKSIFWLVLTTILQVILFITRNGNLEQVVQNQVLVYIVLFLGSFVLLNLHNRKMDDTGIEPVTSTM